MASQYRHEKERIKPPQEIAEFARKHQFTDEEIVRFIWVASNDAISDYKGYPQAQANVILQEREEEREKIASKKVDVTKIGSVVTSKEAEIVEFKRDKTQHPLYSVTEHSSSETAAA